MALEDLAQRGAFEGPREPVGVDQRKILGENALRVNGLDAGTVLKQTGDDEFSRARARGDARPWERIRAQQAPAGRS